ncbi:HRDC domain-containing protein [Ammoniphilus sp. CFH 90114]|uniref:HRDC domain-containing protein n=1 Tax=Ammoniphilus sp. CFH 90114 TaxID=2493665 RepID=UPI00100E087F|nr:HRDC domain-containing protein [Ammoniphilus sp. CFH 90114]RXT08090.1 hypothetical protein EIZ39_11815 [Ammoniphilus sp. CFH 90114]
MLSHVYYLLTLAKPTGEKGKIIIFQRGENYEAHWTSLLDGMEETIIQYTGKEKDKAWQTAEALQLDKGKEGFTPDSPLLTLSLSAIPTPYQFLRKLECFSQKNMNPALFQDLRKWRKYASSKGQIPPYFIATDKLLSILATFIPHNEEELRQIPGIGIAKVEQYGKGILELTQKLEQPYPFPLEWVKDVVSAEELSIWLFEEKVTRDQKREIRREQELEEKKRLLQAMQSGEQIETIVKKLNMSMTQLMKRIIELSTEGYEVIPYLQHEVNRINEKEQIQAVVSTKGATRLKPIFEELYGDGKSLPAREKGEKYNQIRLICTLLQLKSAS